MSTQALELSALILFLAGLGMLGVDVARHYRRRRLQGQVMERALQGVPANDAAADDPVEQRWWRRAQRGAAALGARFESSRLGKALVTPEDRLLLGQVNANTAQGRATFLGLRLALALLLPLPALLWLQPSGVQFAIVTLCAAAFGLLAPKFVLGALARRLRRRTEEELPLLVDLLRLLQGVGFSVDQSLQMIGDRFGQVMPVLSREVREANATYVRGRSRLQSLHRLTEFGNEGLQGLVQLIVQVHEHGGAVQEPLRQFADRLREQRKLRMKEQSGKLSVKMTVVMMLTLLPALMLVLAGPAVISLVGTMAKLKGH